MNSINHNLMAANVAGNLNSYYGRLATSVERLSSGLRVNSAADDAAGLAIRELMRADVAALSQGMRNASDAISLLQVADGALSIIDEKLIRMKELAEQAATGTYDSIQRQIIASEFQAMGAEIDRIVNATDFNGIKLLDGSLSGAHDGGGLNSKGRLKIHFGSGNDEAEDYYYIGIPNMGLANLNLGQTVSETITVSGQGKPSQKDFAPGYIDADAAAACIMGDGITIVSAAFTGNDKALGKYDNGEDSGLGNVMDTGIFLSTGDIMDAQNAPNDEDIEYKEWHLPGDPLLNTGSVQQYDAAMLDIRFIANSDKIYFNFVFATEEWPEFLDTDYNDMCSIILDGDAVNGNYAMLENIVSIDGMPVRGHLSGPINLNNIFNNPDLFIDNYYSGNKLAANGISRVFRVGIPVTPNQEHSLHFSVVDLDDETLDSWIMINGMSVEEDQPITYRATTRQVTRAINIATQEKAQKALQQIDEAIVQKDRVRAHLGALQNRLENTVTNISIQSENLLAAESRISNADVATEMTQLVRNQILTQSAVAMLGQANSYPHMLMRILQG